MRETLHLVSTGDELRLEIVDVDARGLLLSEPYLAVSVNGSQNFRFDEIAGIAKTFYVLDPRRTP